MTYKEVNEAANQLAWWLRDKGIKPDQIVGVLADRSPKMLIAIMGILKAGGAYLPIDPKFPKERINYLLKQSQTSLLLVDTNEEELNFFCPTFSLKSEDLWISFSTSNPPLVTQNTDLAYVIYTSGSTGNPKGVMVEHHSVVNRICWMQKKYPLDTSAVILQKTTFTFDVSVWELFWWSFVGASVYLLPPDGEKNPSLISKVLQDEKISTLHFVPSMFQMFLDYLEQKEVEVSQFKHLQQVFTSGEALEKHHVEQFNTQFSDVNHIQLVNLYGPTEATVDVTFFNCNQSENFRKIPIGKPIDNTQIYILDQNQNLLPERIPGELYIGGKGVARGYLNNPLLTEQRFIQHEHTQSSCLLYTSPSPRDATLSRMPSSA